MYDILHEAMREVSTSLAKQTELCLNHALNKRLGLGAWSPMNLEGRLRFWRSCGGEKWEHYQLDGVPLVSFGPPTMFSHADGDEYKIVVKREVMFHQKASGTKKESA